MLDQADVEAPVAVLFDEFVKVDGEHLKDETEMALEDKVV
jgi:hypothetical protein